MTIIAAVVLTLGIATRTNGQPSCSQSDDPAFAALDDVVYAVRPPNNGAITIAVLANDIIPTGVSVTMSISQLPPSGTAVVSGTNILYTPGASFTAVSFRYTLTNAAGSTSTATVQVIPQYSVTITGSCAGIGCLFDAKPQDGNGNPSYEGVWRYVWTFGDNTAPAVSGSRAYHEYEVERDYVVSVTVQYYSGQTVTGTFNLSFHLARILHWPVTVQGLAAITSVTWEDLQTFPGGGNGNSVRVWWSDYAYPCGQYPAPNCSTEPQNVTYFTTGPAADIETINCTGVSDCRFVTVYARGGTYRLRLQLINRNTGAIVDEFTKYITVTDEPPRPRISAQQQRGRSYTFKLAPRTDDWDVDEIPRDWVNSALRPGPYDWDFGDGTYWTTTNHADTYNKTFTGAGQYPVTLKVTDAKGQAGFVTQNVTVINQPPSGTIVSFCEGLKCRFYANSLDDTSSGETAQWDFGEGAGLESAWTHTYNAPGCYLVRLRVTDEDGAVADLQRTISVAEQSGVPAGRTVVDTRSGSASLVSAYYSEDVPTTGNLNGILEPGEIVLVERTWPTSGNTLPVFTMRLSDAPPVPSAPGFTARRYNFMQDVSYAMGGPVANCVAVGRCQVIGVTATAPRTTAHVDLNWSEMPPGQPNLPVTVHVGESFADVPKTVADYSAVESILHAGLTNGCAPTAFCATEALTRDQIAVWLLRAKYGRNYVPPACTASPFPDVVCSPTTPPRHWAVDWIAKLKDDGIATGNGNGLYEPARALTRAEIAVFLLRTKYGRTYVPPACTPDYVDVTCGGSTGHWGAPWISDLKRKIGEFSCGTSGLGVMFCPDTVVTRASAATFFTAGFELGIAAPQCNPSTVTASTLKTVGATILNSSPALNPDWAAGYAIDGNPVTDYASQGAGTNTFIDFDLGSVQNVVEVQFADRRCSGLTNNCPGYGGDDTNTASQFDLVFSTDAVFGNADDQRYPGISGGRWGDSQVRPNFGAGIPARYIRYDVTFMHSGGSNAGAAEFVFKVRPPGASQAAVRETGQAEVMYGRDMSYEIHAPVIEKAPENEGK
ncbi:MAG TPA: PKD domain-containing protein [Thermoanaerobaculia bacterium]|nr:PKD domain-containing protein [Thermoanaerobaculia bacterium]